MASARGGERVLGLLLLLSWALAGCLDGAPGDAADGPASEAPAAQSPSAPERAGIAWRELPAGGRPLSALAVREHGVGVVFVEPDPWGAYDADDTVVVRAAPDAGSDPVALFLRDTLFAFHLLVPASDADGATGLAFEFAYEELGLPGLTAPDSLGWVPVAHGLSGADTLHGWVRVDGVTVGWRSWEEQLVDVPLFLLPGAESPNPFRTEPGGSPVDLRPGDDYILHPLEARGPWLRVEVVRPSDYCRDPAEPRRDTAWIRHLDDRGRPRAWYHTRGC